MAINQEKLEIVIKDLLSALNVDIQDEGVKGTPKRVAKAYEEILSGYGRELKDEMTVFNNKYMYDDIIYSGKINFFSTCEHHLLPFFGVAHIAYIPNDKLIGLSKLSRAVDIFSRRLSDQERITMQIVNEINNLLKPKGVAVMLEAQHFCNISRGVEKINSNMKTIAFKGTFKENDYLRESFMKMVTS